MAEVVGPATLVKGIGGVVSPTKVTNIRPSGWSDWHSGHNFPRNCGSGTDIGTGICGIDWKADVNDRYEIVKLQGVWALSVQGSTDEVEKGYFLVNFLVAFFGDSR